MVDDGKEGGKRVPCKGVTTADVKFVTGEYGWSRIKTV